MISIAYWASFAVTEKPAITSEQKGTHRDADGAGGTNKNVGAHKNDKFNKEKSKYKGSAAASTSSAEYSGW